MSTFYLLPPRPYLGDCVAHLLRPLLPGVAWDPARRGDLAEVVETALSRQGDVFVVYREDLPAGEVLDRALADGYGAQSGDEVVEVRPGVRPGELTARRWRLN